MSNARPLNPQRGVATLAIVMVLFFVVSLVAAYTNRNLIFEQRTSANYFRATHSFEVAQAGLDWATAMMNGGRIDANCDVSTDVTLSSFRDRYISIDPVTGYITPLNKAATVQRRSAACVYNGTGWDCRCPTDADPSPPAPTGNGLFPAFRVRFNTLFGSSDAGFIRLEAVGCPRLDLAAGGCLDFDSTSGDEGRQFMSVVLALQPSIKTTPAAPLTVRGDYNTPGATMRITNGDVASGGYAVQTGDPTPVLGSTVVQGPAGEPGTEDWLVFKDDPSLSNLVALDPLIATPEDRMFTTTFGLLPDDHRQQPAAYQLTGCPCNAATLRLAAQLNPGRPIWVLGNLLLNSAGDIGDATQPVLVVVQGNITATADVTIHGVVYARTDTWTISGNAVFRGAAIAEKDFAGTGTSTFAYDADLLRRLRVTHGSFVPLPGSWKDFPR